MDNNYHREYNINRYHKRRQEFIELLGSSCVECGSREELEFDHIDPSTKLFSIGKLLNVGKIKALEELAKCQLLCKSCHKVKTIKQNSVGHGEGLTGKRNCRCKLCAPLKNEYQKRYR